MRPSICWGTKLSVLVSVVLVLGVCNTATAQLTWELRSPLIDSRTGSGVEGASASLIDGKIYVSHGYRFGDSAYLSVYDIASDTWTHGGPSAPDAAVARSEMAGGTAFGMHYAIGGRTGPTAAVEQFDPVTSTWTTEASMSMARGGLGAASWDNEIYAIGGRDGGTFGSGTIFGLNEVYNPMANSWTTLAPMLIPVSDNYATLALGGKVYVFGGATSPGTVIGAVQIYDIASNSWSFGLAMPTPRAAAMAGIINGEIAVFGGFDGLSNLAVTELYDPITNTWSAGPDMLVPVSEMAQGVTYDSTGVYAIGTGIFGPSGSVVQVLVPEPGTWLLLVIGMGLCGWCLIRRCPRSAGDQTTRPTI
jgi:N-acetylneuraminic acid mutarotase